MVLCGPGCVVCCDFCKYCIHEKAEINGIITNCEPIGCSLHPDKEHQRKQNTVRLVKTFIAI